MNCALYFSTGKKVQPPEDFLYPCCQRACVESVHRVMPLSRFAAEAFGVVTICLVAILVLLGLIVAVVEVGTLKHQFCVGCTACPKKSGLGVCVYCLNIHVIWLKYKYIESCYGSILV